MFRGIADVNFHPFSGSSLNSKKAVLCYGFNPHGGGLEDAAGLSNGLKHIRVIQNGGFWPIPDGYATMPQGIEHHFAHMACSVMTYSTSSRCLW
jgi:hypothetical protein